MSQRAQLILPRTGAAWAVLLLVVALLLTACGGTPVRSAATPVSSVLLDDRSDADALPAESTPMAVDTPSASTGGVGSSESCRSDPAPVFTHHYTDLDQIDFINPTIVTSGNWLKNRQYHKVVTDADNRAPEVPVYAPVDAVATGVTHYLGQMRAWDGSLIELAQYDLRFRVSCEVTFGFDHVSWLAPPFASLAPVEPSRGTRDAEVPLSVAVEAGQLIGWTSGTEPAHTWDFIVANTTTINEFANQERYERSGDLGGLLHASCPYDYFAPEMAEAYRAKLGNWQGRAAEVDCALSPDEPGALAGGWFLSPFDGSDRYGLTDWGLVAALAGDGYLDLNGPDVAIRVADDDPSFLDPASMTDEHCYVHYQGSQWAYVALLSATELAVAFGEGACPAVLPAVHQVFHR